MEADRFNWKAELAKYEWAEGRTFALVDGSYRTRVAVTCYAAGRQTAVFAGGVEGNYGAYVELIRPDGTCIRQGTNVVPILPDGRLIMVVEQRPAQWRFDGQPATLIVGDELLDLTQFGPYSSVEFPGGAVDTGDTLTAGFLRELEEETEVEEQTALLYARRQPLFPQGSDLALEGFLSVVFLSRHRFSGFVKSDGGLNVLALSRQDVQRNIWAGNIRSAQAALLGWAWYQEVLAAQADVARFVLMSSTGYLNVKNVHLGVRK